ncbi:MAG: hydantoinase/oxoprolinase family protein [Anaerolineae bacterium]|nr:hydantoinase/oxoprolinase family protein [Anaerolineae bacterium]
MAPHMRLGIDVGGTFTDLVLIDDRSGKIHYTKTFTTPGNPAQGVLTGIEKILRIANAAPGDLEYIAHGTTIGTNALIERQGARVGLITTAGFRDVLEIARIERPDAGLYDINVDLPAPLVPRYLRLEADERMGADGSIVRPLDTASVVQAIEKFQTEHVQAIAICLLFGFRNPVHEHLIREMCQEILPDVPVTLAGEIAPEFREFERTSTTVINAYLTPITERYLDSLQAKLQASFGAIDLRIMQTSGGAMTAQAARSRAVNMVNSGPAGGALATALFGRLTGDTRIIGCDMGGTSFDIGLIVDAHPRVKSEGEFEGYPVKIPMIDVEGIGAGGGSIAWVDAGGGLNVGPRSAGSDPGPACYGQGGIYPTVTDANLALGRLNPDYFLGSEIQLHPDRAQAAIQEYVASPLKMSVAEAAAGILRVVNANMVRGISVNSTQKGYDTREFSLLAFGGAGPLHAVELAQELGMRRVIVPPFCSVFSAFGAVTADLRHDYVRTVALSQAEATAERLEPVFRDMETHARAQLAQENVSPEAVVVQWAADLRYEGQSYELTIPVANDEPRLTDPHIAETIQLFHDTHSRVYAYGDPGERVECVSLRLTAIGRAPALKLARQKKTARPAKPKSKRKVYFFERGFVMTAIYERSELRPGHKLTGPSLIEETTSTTVVPPRFICSVDVYGNLLIEPALRSKAARSSSKRAPKAKQAERK